MTLKEWRQREGLTQTLAGARVGIDQGRFSAYEAGRSKPTGETIRRIERATNGAVCFSDFFPVAADVNENEG